MKLSLISVGRAKKGPLSDLFDLYAKRLSASRWGRLVLTEVEERRPLPREQRQRREAQLIQAALPKGATPILLDEAGESLDSRAFAKWIQAMELEGHRDLAFVIGGADGLDPSLIENSHRQLAFGIMTWPHMMVRLLLAEQLYRAHTILTDHPYHRD